MTDERTDGDETRPERFDDDRLLACALGLEEDPELLAAAEADTELAARLAVMREEVEIVGTQVRAAVPAPDDSYADLSSERWSGLSEYLRETPGRPRRRRRWLRVLAPVTAALVLAVVVGVVATDQGDRRTASDSGADAGRVAGEAASTVSQSPSAAEAAPRTTAERLAEQLDRFAIVVLARARAASGALQSFAVVRIFKGEAPQVVELEVADHPADAGRLHLLMLDPVDSAEDEDLLAGSVPSPVTARGDLGYGTPLAVSYRYNGEPTMVREFETGTDPDSVDLPLP
ncbi:MAG: hypothetical protein GX624_04925 [Actinobacteria bacterium]|nr:hypothetical protein [Actinomycetota bacterium]